MENMMASTMPIGHNTTRKEAGVNNWLGKSFAVGKNGEREETSDRRALIFAGMKGHKRTGMNQANLTSRTPFKGRPPLH